MFLEIKPKIEAALRRLQNPNALRRCFLADPVAGDNRNLVAVLGHGADHLLRGGGASFAAQR
jgi:hypothetical protein